MGTLHDKKNGFKAMPDEKSGYKGEYVRRRANIDQALLENVKTNKSLAIHKYKFKGKDGIFATEDLEDWHNLYNQTRI